MTGNRVWGVEFLHVYGHDSNGADTGFGVLGSGVWGFYMYGHDRGRGRQHQLQAGL